MSSALEKGLYSKLSGQTTAKDRIYPRLPEQVIYPAIRYQRVSTIRSHAIDGAVGVTEAMVQVDCVAKTYSQAKALADAVRGVLHDYTGTWGTLQARHVTLDMETDFYDQDGDRVTHWVMQQYRIWTNMD